MARILIVYGTTEGHTALIAERIGGAIRSAGQEVELHDAKDIRKQKLTGAFDGVIVGGSIHAGDYQGNLREFVKGNRALLEDVPSAFFTVSLSAADPDEEARADIQSTVQKFVQETGWQPRHVVPIAGALVYTHYNIFVRHLMKLIAKSHGRTELDTSQDYDFTDWAAVESFGREFAEELTKAARVA
jgi:menaquinone-dependent protoporphyrinogen oxidase